MVRPVKVRKRSTSRRLNLDKKVLLERELVAGSALRGSVLLALFKLLYDLIFSVCLHIIGNGPCCPF